MSRPPTLPSPARGEEKRKRLRPQPSPQGGGRWAVWRRQGLADEAGRRRQSGLSAHAYLEYVETPHPTLPRKGGGEAEEITTPALPARGREMVGERSPTLAARCPSQPAGTQLGAAHPGGAHC